MPRVCYVILVALSVGVLSYGQRTNVLPGNINPGGADVANDVRWQAFTNPAVASLSNSYMFEISYENKYLTKELSNKTISAIFPTKYFNITASFNHFGYSVYNEMLMGVGFSRNFGRWRLGIEVDAMMVYVSPTENYACTLTGQIGAQVDVSESVTLGFSLFNPVFSSIESTAPLHLPVRLSAGVNYRMHDKVKWLVQVDADIRNTVFWRTGFEYRPFEEFVVRAGAWGSDFIRPSIGLGMDMKGFMFDLNCEVDPRIGVCLMGALRYEIDN